MYYVLDNLCPTLEDAEEVVLLYKIAGVAAEIVPEATYFERLHWTMIPYYDADNSTYWNDPV